MFAHGSGIYRIATLALAPLTLTACDSAGTVLDDTARVAAVEQCRAVSESAGIAAGAVNKVCECAADTWLAKPMAERVKLDRTTIQGIVNKCAGTDGTAETPAATETY